MNLSTHCHAVTKVEQTKVSWPYVPLFGLSRASALLHTLYSKKLVRRNSGLCKCGHGEKLVIYTRSLIWRRDIFIISTLLTTKRLSSRYTLATSSPIGYLKFLGRTDNWVTVKLTLWEWQISFLDANIHALLVQAVTLDSLLHASPRPSLLSLAVIVLWAHNMLVTCAHHSQTALETPMHSERRASKV